MTLSPARISSGSQPPSGPARPCADEPGAAVAFAGAFALCETAMPLAGLALGRAVAAAAGRWAEGIGVGVLMLCGLFIVVFSLRGEEPGEELAGSRLALAGLPLSLSLDNLAAGVGLGSLGFTVIGSALTSMISAPYGAGPFPDEVRDGCQSGGVVERSTCWLLRCAC